MRMHVLALLVTVVLMTTAGMVRANGVAAERGAWRTGANSCISCLGPPTNDIGDYSPLGGFHRVKLSLTSHLRPELLLLTVPGEVETWPLVKALAQFGTFTGLAPDQFCGKQGAQTECTAPVIDLSHAHFRSRYVTFVERYIIDRDDRLLQPLTKSEHAIFNRYANPGGTDLADQARRAAGITTGTKRLPLVAIGGYLQTASDYLFPGDFTLNTASGSTTSAPGAATFDQVLATLRAGTPVDGVGPTMIRDVNIESNIITAIVCHADALQPKKVCGRAVIKKLLKHVK